MQTLTSRSTSRRRWARFLGTGATALVAATTIGSAAGAATTAANAPGGATGSVAALSASSMEVQNPSTGQTTVSWTTDDAVLQDGDRGGQLAGGRRLRHRDRDAVEEVQDHDRGPQHHRHAPPTSTGSCTVRRPRSGGTSAGGAFGRRRRLRLPGRRGGGAEGGTRPELPGGGSARQLPQAAGHPRHRVGQGHRRQRLDGHRVGHRASARGASRAARSSSSKSSKTKKPAAPEDREPHDHDVELDDGERDAVGSRRPTSPSVTASAPSVRPPRNGAVTATTVRITSTGGASCTGGFGGGGFFRGGGGFGGGAPGGGSA